LRKLAYQWAVEEVAMINQTITDTGRPWQVHEVQITEHVEDNRLTEGPSRADIMRSSSPSSRSFHAQSSEGEDDESPDLSVGNKVIVTAAVTLQRPAVQPPAGGFFAVQPRT